MTHHSTKWFSFKINHSENNVTFQYNKYKVNFETLYVSLKTNLKKTLWSLFMDEVQLPQG